MMINIQLQLEFWRKRKGLSQAELAKLMNKIWIKNYGGEDTKHYSTDMVSRMERNPDTISFPDLLVMQEALGVSSDQLLNSMYIPPELPKIKNRWKRILKLRKWGDMLVKACPDEELAQRLKDAVEKSTRKPKIAFLGRPDAGKTTLISICLGEDGQWLPIGWAPETSAVCHIKHISDRPSWAGNDKVLVFSSPDDSPFDVDAIADDPGSEQYCKENCICAGGYDLLKNYATHNGKANAEEIDAIVIFSDAPILQNCDLIDLPGFNPEGVTVKGEDAAAEDIYDSRDSMLSSKAINNADAIVYMSIANSFCLGEDAEMIKTVATSLPILENKSEQENPIEPFGNLFIVASHAMAVGDQETLDNEVLYKAAKRIWKRIENHPSIKERKISSGYDCDIEAFRKRFFTSESKSDQLTNRFLTELVHFTEVLPVVQSVRAKNELRRFCKDYALRLKSKLAGYRAARDKRDAQIAQLESDEKQAADEKVDEDANPVLSRIDMLREESLEEVYSIYNEVISVSNIRDLIDENGYKKNKRDMSELSNDLNSELNNKVSQMLLEKSRLLSIDIDRFITELEDDFSGPDLESISAQFNVGNAFAGGFAGAASFGALAAWAATFGNLGGYIIVAKAVSVLAGLGIHLGGTAAVISAISAIGGPVTIGIGIAVMAGLGFIALLGGTWKKTIGKKIVKQYERAGALTALEDQIEEFWNETVDTFKKGRDNIVKEWKESLSERRLILMENNEGGKLDDMIGSTQALIDYINDAAAQLDEITFTDED